MAAKDFSHKTRILIVGHEAAEAENLLKSAAECSGRPLIFAEDVDTQNTDSEFVVFKIFNPEIKPNIILLTGKSSDQQAISALCEEITAGGIFIYDEENEVATSAAENATRFFRKVASTGRDATKNGENFSVKTSLGTVTFTSDVITDPGTIPAVLALCKHLLISEEDFIESLFGA